MAQKRTLLLSGTTDTSTASLASVNGDTIQEIETILEKVGSLAGLASALPGVGAIPAEIAALDGPVIALLAEIDSLIRGTVTAVGGAIATPVSPVIAAAPTANPAGGSTS